MPSSTLKNIGSSVSSDAYYGADDLDDTDDLDSLSDLDYDPEVVDYLLSSEVPR